MPKITKIKSNENSTFFEGNSNIKFVFIGETFSNNNTKINYWHSKRGTNEYFSLTIKKSDLIYNKEIITKRKQKEKYSELGTKDNNLPFLDSNDIEFVQSEKNIKNISTGIIQDRFSFNVFEDTEKDIKNVVLNNLGILNSTNNVKYPFSFNYYNFSNRSGKIDIFGNIQKIQAAESEIEKEKGFKSNVFKYSKNAFGDNNQIEQLYTKKDKNVYHYEDAAIESILYSDIDKMVVDGIKHTINPETLVETKEYFYRKINTFSKEQRYFAFKECNINAFSDIGKSDDWELQKNRYSLTNVEINSKINNQENLNLKINEKILFSSHGKDCDFSLSNGRESIAFFGVKN